MPANKLPFTRAELSDKARKYGLQSYYKWTKEKLYEKICFIETAKGYQKSQSSSVLSQLSSLEEDASRKRS